MVNGGQAQGVRPPPVVSRSRRGVTLVELLIAVTLVGMLSVGMLLAIRVALNALEKTNEHLIANRRVLGAQRAIDQQIGSMIPMNAVCAPPGGEPKKEKLLFFQGEPNALRFVTSHSLEESARGYPRILEYLVIPGQRGEGVRLVVNEHLYAGPHSLAFFCSGVAADPITGRNALQMRPVETGPRSFVLADRLAVCRLSYHVIEPKTREALWMPVYAGEEPPAAVRMEMAPLEPGGSMLRMSTMTVPVRVTRNAALEYTDVDRRY
jgi:prepilin-type N-terminal cleavage/methylation domain-containing protein